MVSFADVDDNANLYAGGAFKSVEHGICVWVFEGYDVVSCVGGSVSFLVGYDVYAIGCRLEGGGCEREVVVYALD